MWSEASEKLKIATLFSRKAIEEARRYTIMTDRSPAHASWTDESKLGQGNKRYLLYPGS